MGETGNMSSGRTILLADGPLDGQSHTTHCSPDVLAITAPLLVFDADSCQPIPNRDDLENGKSYIVYRLERTGEEVQFRYTEVVTREEINRFETLVVNRAAAPILYVLSFVLVPAYILFLGAIPPLVSVMGSSPWALHWFAGWLILTCLGAALAWYAHHWRPAKWLAITLTIYNLALSPFSFALFH